MSYQADEYSLSPHSQQHYISGGNSHQHHHHHHDGHDYGMDDAVVDLDETLVELEEPVPSDEAAQEQQHGGGGGGKKAGAAAAQRDVIDAMFPPRAFMGPDGREWLQKVSARKPSRDDVVQLQARLDANLQARQARENGLCPVREQLYSQCFDELIRQVTMERPERGLLLLRVRDEIRMTIAAYQTLYQSSTVFATRKSLEAEQGVGDLQERVSGLEERKAQLIAELRDAKSRLDSTEKHVTEQRASRERKRAEEKEFLNYQLQHLETFLKSAQQS